MNRRNACAVWRAVARVRTMRRLEAAMRVATWCVLWVTAAAGCGVSASTEALFCEVDCVATAALTGDGGGGSATGEGGAGGVADGGGGEGGTSATGCTSDAACDDGDPCNGRETCGKDGVCAAGQPPSIDDHVPCTVDSCLPDGTITHTLLPGVDDGNPCTDDTCLLGMVQHNPIPGCHH